MSDLLAHLNPPQLAAVTMAPVHGLILAGAGSGKTRVLTTRIAWLISTQQVSPQGILAVTFTNKAAKEMMARLSAMLPINPKSLWIGTFHGLCNRLLRAHFREAGLPQLFQILDSADQLSAIKRLLKNLNVDDERFPPKELQHFINGHKEKGLRPGTADAWDDYTRRRLDLWSEYEAQCNREGVVDFAELMLRSFELLSRHEPIRTHYQQRFRHILVDEFQDTNVLQYRWLKLLADGGQGARIFAVGDDDQSIYRFRGAEVGNMRDFEREFGVKEVIRLEQNYRSHGNILDAANAIICNNRDRLGKQLWTEAGAGEPIRVYNAANDLEEARFVVDEVRELIRDGIDRKQIALLYRSNAQSRVLEHQLFSAAIPYRVYGGQRFFERKEIKDALAYLRLIANADDDTAFLRVVNFPTRGIGTRSLESLQAAAHQTNSSLYNAAASLSGKAGAAVGAFIRMIEELRQQTSGLPLAEVVEHMLEKSGLVAHYRSEKEGQDRVENLDELINAAANFMAENAAEAEGDLSGATLASFLAHASLEAGDHQAGDNDDALQLMTVHAAKGLEFDAVFLSGLEQGLFPHENAINEDGGLEEERRLMYVAVTRARKRLYLSHAQTRMLHGQTRYCLPSTFLDEIPAALLKQLNSAPAPAYGYSGGQSSNSWSNSGSNSAWAEDKRHSPGFFASADRHEAPRPAPGASAMASEGAVYKVGQVVEHAKFGQGVIVAAEGRGPDARVQVSFGGNNMKWLALEYAKLKVVG